MLCSWTARRNTGWVTGYNSEDPHSNCGEISTRVGMESFP